MIAVGTAVVQVQRENARLPDITEIAAAQRQLWPAPKLLYSKRLSPSGLLAAYARIVFSALRHGSKPLYPPVLAYAP